MAIRKQEFGFTLVELVMTMIVIGILALVALPRMDSVTTFSEAGFRDRVAATLRYAQKTAVSHRRLVCATVAGDQLSLSIASNFGDTSCATALGGPEGKIPATSSPSAGISLNASASPLYFQPSGTVTSDGAGASPANFTLTVSNQTSVAVYGTTGHVE